MVHLLEFIGLIGISAIVARSPRVFRFLEHLLPVDERGRSTAKAVRLLSVERGSHSEDQSSLERLELRDEIRRLTAVLESNHRGAGR